MIGIRTCIALIITCVLAAVSVAQTTVPLADPRPATEEEIRRIVSYAEMPPEQSLPVPPDGWYTVDLGADTIEVFRDAYGVPHVFAPSVEAAFRGQGYVDGEDRCLQVLKKREAVMGRLAAMQGEGSLGHDMDVFIKGHTDEELRALLNDIPEQHLIIIKEYMAGFNEYLRRFAPHVPPVEDIELVAGTVYYMRVFHDFFDQDYDLLTIFATMRALKGEEFARSVLHDLLPDDVWNAPTTDHSKQTRKNAAAPKAVTPCPADFNTDEVLAYLKESIELREFARAEGICEPLGSQAWAVSGSRTTTGNAYLFASPMMGHAVPASAAEVHLVAPGLNMHGISQVGIPGILIGHNESVAWGSTSAIIDHIDLYVEELNPENHLQYKHNGEWKDMDVRETWIAVKTPEGEYEMRPVRACRTVHGPVIRWEEYTNRAYSHCNAIDGLQLRAFSFHLDLALAENLDDFGKAIREIAAFRNYVAADKNGNIGYWLSGRIPKRQPAHDRRLPAPGTGEFDWIGMDIAADIAHVVNPKEGWLGDFNGKPSVKTPGWWPEYAFGHRIIEILESTNPVDWETFISVNRENGEHHFAAPFFRDTAIKLLREKNTGDPLVEKAAQIIEEWPGKTLPGSVGTLLVEEWVKELMVDLLGGDFGFMVQPSMDVVNLQLFGLLTFRLLQPELSGVELQGDYLHGRDPHEIAYRSFLKALRRLEAAHGSVIEDWPFEPGKDNFDGLAEFPARYSGTYWMAVELGKPIRSMSMLAPGQSALRQSPHFDDQFALYKFWQFKRLRFNAEDFGRQ